MSSYLAHICNLLPDLPRLFNKQFFCAAFFSAWTFSCQMEKYSRICTLNYTDILMQILWLIPCILFWTMGNMMLCRFATLSTIFSHYIGAIRRQQQRQRWRRFSQSHLLSVLFICVATNVWLNGWVKYVEVFSVFIELKSFTSVCPSRSFKHVRVTCKIPFDCLLFNRFGVSTGRKKGAFFRLGINKCIY